MPDESHPYLFLAVFLGLAALFPLAPIVLARLWARWFLPAPPGPAKRASYECGLAATGDAWRPLHAGYYLYAIAFLVLDVEAVFLLPFAAAFRELPVGAFVAGLVFLVLLVEGLLWAWAKGILQWK